MKKYRIKNLDCANCALKLENSLKNEPIVKEVSLNFATLTLSINTTDMSQVKKIIKKIEPEVEISDFSLKSEEKPYSFRQESFFLFLSLALYFFTLIFVYLKIMSPLLEIVFFLAVFFLSGWNILLKAFRNILHGNILDENFLMSFASGAAFFISAYSEASGVMLFYKTGEILQEISLKKTRKSIQSLIELRPETASVLEKGEVILKKPEDVQPGNLFLVKPGEKIPLDGLIIKGHSSLDTRSLTGESLPKDVFENDEVSAGMVNLSGVLTVKALRLFKDSSIAKILDLVENASTHKSKTENRLTLFARWYTPSVVILAVLTALLPPLFLKDALFSDWLYRALVMLVISCPCALFISIPIGYFGGIGAASKNGILIKGSNYLEALNQVSAIAFDKTGTLTRGVLTVKNIQPEKTIPEDTLLEYTVLAEYFSNHPIALSIRNFYPKPVDPSRISSHKEHGGFGGEAVIDGKKVLAGNKRLLQKEQIEFQESDSFYTPLYIVIDNHFSGTILLGDTLKPEAALAIQNLKEEGIRDLFILTGDKKETASAVAKEIGIQDYYAELLPEDKIAVLKQKVKTERKKEKLLFVGDGVNDVPVLAGADIGIALGKNCPDAAYENADIVINSDSLLHLPLAFKIAKKTKRIIFQNIVFALGIKLAFILLGIGGSATLWEAVFADVGVALLALLNSMRTLRVKNAAEDFESRENKPVL